MLLYWLTLAATASGLELHGQEQIGAAVFPAGVQVIVQQEARQPLWNSDHVLLRDARVGVYGFGEVTPAYPRLGAGLSFAPVAFWDVAVRGAGTWYFGTFSTLLRVDGPDFVATPDHLQALIDDGGRTGGFGLLFQADSRLKAKVGPYIAVYEATVRGQRLTAWDEPLAYTWDPAMMVIVPASGWVVHQRLLTLAEFVAPAVEHDDMLRGGLMTEWTLSPATDDRNVRIGPLVMWKPTPRLATPTLIFGSQVWVVSRFGDPMYPYMFAAANWAR